MHTHATIPAILCGDVVTAMAASKGSSTSINTSPSPGSPLRRSSTTDEFRRRPSVNPWSPMSEGPSSGWLSRRRSSNLTDFSLDEARDILNPQVQDHKQYLHPETSSLAQAALAFALLPAIAGVLFKNGATLVTDLMLLGLAGIFLHWSVSQPWRWYHSAREVRVQSETIYEETIEDDGETGSIDKEFSLRSSPLADVPEQEPLTKPSVAEKEKTDLQVTRRNEIAFRELYRHEILALLACFIFPLASAYLLNFIRSQLSRPSEGLVSDFNLTIYMLVAEIRVFSHLFKLVHSRTLHLQRIVQGQNHSSNQDAEHLGIILERLTSLENRLADDSRNQPSQKPNDRQSSDKEKQELIRQVRNSIESNLEALNRAMRTYERKITAVHNQTSARFASLETRLDDAISLAAAAARNSSDNILLRLIESLVSLLMMPINALPRILLFPVTIMTSTFGSGKQRKKVSASIGQTQCPKATRSTRPATPTGGSSKPLAPNSQTRYSDNIDRVTIRTGRR